MNTLQIFRLAALLEGISLVILMLVCMPLKYMGDMPEPTRMVGMTHGVLFILYVILLIMVKMEHNWGFRKLVLAFIASLLPFGTFVADVKLFRESA